MAACSTRHDGADYGKTDKRTKNWKMPVTPDYDHSQEQAKLQGCSDDCQR
jgi:hypothetical protein